MKKEKALYIIEHLVKKLDVTIPEKYSQTNNYLTRFKKECLPTLSSYKEALFAIKDGAPTYNRMFSMFATMDSDKPMTGWAVIASKDGGCCINLYDGTSDDIYYSLSIVSENGVEMMDAPENSIICMLSRNINDQVIVKNKFHILCDEVFDDDLDNYDDFDSDELEEEKKGQELSQETAPASKKSLQPPAEYVEDENDYQLFEDNEFREECVRIYRLDNKTGDLERCQSSDGKYGYKDWTGNIVIPCIWDDAREKFENGLAVVKDSTGKYGVIDKSGQLVYPCCWEDIEIAPWEWYVKVQDPDDKWGIVDMNGNMVVPCKWEDVGLFIENGCVSVKDVFEKWGFVDINDKLVIPCQWEDVGMFSDDGLVSVKDVTGKWGYIDKNGAIVIPCQWDEAGDFIYDITAVMDSNGNYGCIDKTGTLVVDCRWAGINIVDENVAWVQDKNEKYGLIDWHGNILAPCQWTECDYFHDDVAIVRDDNGKYGMIDITGRMVTPCKWERIGHFEGGVAEVEDADGNTFGIDKTGKILA